MWTHELNPGASNPVITVAIRLLPCYQSIFKDYVDQAQFKFLNLLEMRILIFPIPTVFMVNVAADKCF